MTPTPIHRCKTAKIGSGMSRPPELCQLDANISIYDYFRASGKPRPAFSRQTFGTIVMKALIGTLARQVSGANIPQILESLTGHMKLFLRALPLALIILGAVMLSERPAYAYADPGSGLLAIQAAGSALVATGWYLRRKIYALFHRDAPQAKTEELPGAATGEDSRNRES
jgi:hypothetical protein